MSREKMLASGWETAGGTAKGPPLTRKRFTLIRQHRNWSYPIHSTADLKIADSFRPRLAQEANEAEMGARGCIWSQWVVSDLFVKCCKRRPMVAGYLPLFVSVLTGWSLPVRLGRHAGWWLLAEALVKIFWLFWFIVASHHKIASRL